MQISRKRLQTKEIFFPCEFTNGKYKTIQFIDIFLYIHIYMFGQT